MRRGLVTCLAVALAAPASVRAADDSPPLASPGEAVPGHPGMDYIALLRIAIPDLALNPDDHEIEGHLSDPPPRHIAGHAFEGKAPDPVSFSSAQDKRILVGGHRRIALLADLGPDPGRADGTALLVLFDDEGPVPRVLDMADVGVDRYTIFADQPALGLGPGDEALLTYSERSNDDVTQGGYVLISAVGDRLTMIDQVRVASVNLCAWSETEAAKFITRPDPGSPYRRIEVTVSYVVKGRPERCAVGRSKPGAQVFGAAYRWDGAQQRFVTTSSTLDQLEALNAKAP